jgi:Ca2+-binding RTX toxin-like protein
MADSTEPTLAVTPVAAAPAEGGRLIGGPRADQIDGTPANDVIVGGAGADQVRAGAGQDVLVGGTGDDVLDGGAGLRTSRATTGRYGGTRSRDLVWARCV